MFCKIKMSRYSTNAMQCNCATLSTDTWCSNLLGVISLFYYSRCNFATSATDISSLRMYLVSG